MELQQRTVGGLSNFDLELELYCLAHRKPVRWLSVPMWWHHADGRTCMALWNYPSPRKPDARYTPSKKRGGTR